MSIKGIFLSFEGLNNSIANSQVLEHVESLKSQSIDIEILFFLGKKAIFQKNLELISQYSNYNIKIFRAIDPAIPFSAFLNSIYLFYILFNKKIQFIHARTDYVCSTLFFLKIFTNIKIIWDCRGHTTAEYFSKYNLKNPLKLLYAPIQYFRLEFFVLVCNCIADEAIFVTNELMNARRISVLLKNFYIIPCLTNCNKFFFSNQLRKTTRDKLKYNENDIVLIYSGSITGYQVFEKCLNLFIDLHKKNCQYKLLILSPNIREVNKLINKYNISQFTTILNVPFNDVNAYLNASDIGLLLRENIPLNRCASPIKFAEYSVTGLYVLNNRSVNQVYENGLIIGNLLKLDNSYKANFDFPIFSINNREMISLKSKELYDRTNYLNIYNVIYAN